MGVREWREENKLLHGMGVTTQGRRAQSIGDRYTCSDLYMEWLRGLCYRSHFIVHSLRLASFVDPRSYVKVSANNVPLQATINDQL